MATVLLSLSLHPTGRSVEWAHSHSAAISGAVSYRLSVEWTHNYRAAVSGAVSYRLSAEWTHNYTAAISGSVFNGSHLSLARFQAFFWLHTLGC